MINEGVEPRGGWQTIDESFEQFVAISEKLSRRHRLTPKPAYKGACGVPLPNSLLVTLTYRCQCGSVRNKVVPVLIGSHYNHEPVGCLRCRTFNTTFEKLEFHSL